MTKPITDTLRHIDGGCFLDEAAEKLSALVLAVDQTGKAGSLTIKIDLRKATAGAMAVKGKVTVKPPEPAPFEALLFPTPEGNLLSEDPRQQRLELKAVAAPSASTEELKTITA